jgi:hypothetical protein
MSDERWPLIAGAPRDGSLVLAWCERWELPGYVQWHKDSFTLTARWRDPYGDDDLEHPTHFCPAATVRACRPPPGLGEAPGRDARGR